MDDDLQVHARVTEHGRNPRWHSYYGRNVDTSVLHDQANAKMRDIREASSTVVHHHRADEPCKDHDHTLYDHEVPQTISDIRVDDGYTAWGVPDPMEKNP